MIIVQAHELKDSARRLIRSTLDNSVRESGLYRCEKHGGHTYIACLGPDGRALDFVKVEGTP